jgi:predicted NAD/FAD-binding protein
MHSSSYANTTVSQFLANEPPFRDNPAFAGQCVLPRVNAMYFCSPTGPEAMPIQTAYLYYLFQEGFGTDSYASPNGPAPMVDRQYFLLGSRSFVDALRADAKAAGAKIHSGSPASLIPGGSPRVQQNAEYFGPFDAVVMTIHADQAAAALPPDYDPEVLAMLRKVSYAPSTAYVHQDASLLPAPELRRTYNVLVRGPGESTEYAMTYVINQHQADRENLKQQYFDCPEYYVSLNPIRTPKNILVDSRTGKPAIYSFPHNVGDLGLRSAQTTLWRTSNPIQGRNKLWFAGGWTVGAGLMIECWQAVQELYGLLAGGKEAHAAYDEARPTEHFAPRYIRRLRPPQSAVTLSRGTPRRR